MKGYNKLMNIDLILDNIYPLPDTSKELLKKSITAVKYRKGHILLRADKIENNIYFIKKGVARAYSNKGNTEITFWIGKEDETIISMKSYIANQKGYEDVELLEDCELYELNTTDLQRLFENDIHIANWGRRFAEKELIKTEERLISRQVRTATERYKALLDDSPDLIKRVQLGHIASYLGITQVSLSRIRAEIK
ncbi:MAG: Crp/Fnr family transcriptional regulator [Sphingobacterium sp.]|uniref:Crp/Fnr family transcriptional regulator n=1 Tax=Sphingobacterium sp. JB170 TaxID=1434842 RepID=UPI00097F3B8B|nr:Crp/Fnr family transcriptional regulator [Sphingobacterium sp. JB170]SJN20964.1 cAMP-binding proteins-catabolite gene activator and regulatory subunit of cAMP-dependent protein kinases [Sphingobacterium sp. JB170]